MLPSCQPTTSRSCSRSRTTDTSIHTDCAASLTVTNLNVGNSRLPANRVFLGHLKVHPAQVPFTLHRLPG